MDLALGERAHSDRSATAFDAPGAGLLDDCGVLVDPQAAQPDRPVLDPVVDPLGWETGQEIEVRDHEQPGEHPEPVPDRNGPREPLVVELVGRVALLAEHHRAGARAGQDRALAIARQDRSPERRVLEHADRVLGAAAGEVDPVGPADLALPARIVGVLAANDHHTDGVRAEGGEVRDPVVGPGRRRLLLAGRGRHDRHERACLRNRGEDPPIEVVHDRRELARAEKHEATSPHALFPTSRSGRPWKRFHIRSKFFRLRLSRSSSESASQARWACRRARSTPVATMR